MPCKGCSLNLCLPCRDISICQAETMHRRKLRLLSWLGNGRPFFCAEREHPSSPFKSHSPWESSTSFNNDGMTPIFFLNKLFELSGWMFCILSQIIKKKSLSGEVWGLEPKQKRYKGEYNIENEIWIRSYSGWHEGAGETTSHGSLNGDYKI